MARVKEPHDPRKHQLYLMYTFNVFIQNTANYISISKEFMIYFELVLMNTNTQ